MIFRCPLALLSIVRLKELPRKGPRDVLVRGGYHLAIFPIEEIKIRPNTENSHGETLEQYDSSERAVLLKNSTATPTCYLK